MLLRELSTLGFWIKQLIRSRALGRNVSYNFLIGDDGSGHPSSSRDALGHVADLEDVGETLHHVQGPGLLVKVLDREANCELLLVEQ